MKHVTKDGKKIKLCDLDLSHLKNIINWIEKKSNEGLIIRSGGGSCAEDMWYDEEMIKGNKAKKYLNYSKYVDELNKRLK